MLQFITHPSDRFSIPEEVQMVLEGGCKWIQLRLKDVDDSEFREIAMEVIPLCRENGAFLIIDDRVELAKELGVHGVHLGKDDMSPAEARELMGPEAIIGVTANTAQEIIALKGLDVDYVGLGPFRFTSTKEKLATILGLDGYRQIVSEVREAGIELPIVAIGGITADDLDEVISTGVNGVAVSGAIIGAEDPVAYTEKCLSILGR